MDRLAFWDASHRGTRTIYWRGIVTRLREPSLTVFVILQSLVTFVVGPLADMHVLPGAVVGALMLASVGIVVILAAGSRWLIAAVIVSAIIDSTSTIVNRLAPSVPILAIDFVGRLILFIVVTIILLRVLFGDQEGTYHRILGGIAVYLNIGIMFAFVYRISQFFDPHAFAITATVGTGLSQFMYFSFVTLTTTGYGDIVPVNPLVRSAANLEAVTGQLFTATLLARLVSLYFAAGRGPAREPERP